MKKADLTESFHSVRGERIKTIYQELNLSQGELAERVNMKQSAISEMVNGKRTVTETTARAIVEEFPQYRFEWLMGYDDYKTLKDLNLAIYQQAQHEGNLLDIGFFYFAKLNGYAVEHPDFSKAHYVDEALDLINHGYRITKGDQSRQLSINELRDLEIDICDYIGYRLDRYMEKGR